MASGGLYLLATAGPAAGMIFVAATLYGVGKTFFWPTTLGIVSEQFPKGGALTLNAMGGMGMIAVGVLGAPFLGALQDKSLDDAVRTTQPAIHGSVAGPEESHFLLTYRPIDRQKVAALPPADQASVQEIRKATNQSTLAKFALLPALMALGYGVLLLYFRARGGYRVVELSDSRPSRPATAAHSAARP
jgi:hypothetical protein